MLLVVWSVAALDSLAASLPIHSEVLRTKLDGCSSSLSSSLINQAPSSPSANSIDEVDNAADQLP
jgi:hypothetical protein